MQRMSVIGCAAAVIVGSGGMSVAKGEIVEVTLTGHATGDIQGDDYELLALPPITVTFSYDTAAESVEQNGDIVALYPFLTMQATRDGTMVDFLPDAPFTTELPLTAPDMNSIIVRDQLGGDRVTVFGAGSVFGVPLSLVVTIAGPPEALPSVSLPSQDDMAALASFTYSILGPGTPEASGLIQLGVANIETLFKVETTDISVVPEPTAALALLAPLALNRRRRGAC